MNLKNRPIKCVYTSNLALRSIFISSSVVIVIEYIVDFVELAINTINREIWMLPVSPRHNTPLSNTFSAFRYCTKHLAVAQYYDASNFATIEFLVEHFARHLVFVSVFSVLKSAKSQQKLASMHRCICDAMTLTLTARRDNVSESSTSLTLPYEPSPSTSPITYLPIILHDFFFSW